MDWRVGAGSPSRTEPGRQGRLEGPTGLQFVWSARRERQGGIGWSGAGNTASEERGALALRPAGELGRTLIAYLPTQQRSSPRRLLRLCLLSNESGPDRTRSSPAAPRADQMWRAGVTRSGDLMTWNVDLSSLGRRSGG